MTFWKTIYNAVERKGYIADKIFDINVIGIESLDQFRFVVSPPQGWLGLKKFDKASFKPWQLLRQSVFEAEKDEILYLVLLYIIQL